jgi:hypothetical protein
MPTNACDRLRFLDRSFLMLETPTSPMHIAGSVTFEAGPLQTTDGGVDIDTIRDYVTFRLHLIPRNAVHASRRSRRAQPTTRWPEPPRARRGAL